MTENWLIAGIALLALLCGFISGSFVSGRQLDKTFAEGEDKGYDWGWVDAKALQAQASAPGEPAQSWLLGELEAVAGPLADYLRGDEAEWAPAPTDEIAIHARYYETPSPANPSAGEGKEPPGTARDSGPHSGDGLQEPFDSAAATGTGPGADPLFAGLDDKTTFALIQWELGNLARKAREPFTLTGWEAA